MPCGTLLYDLETDNPLADLINNQDELLICKGGSRGFGNLRYKSSTNRSPTKFTEGKEGDSLSLRLELRLLADIGLLGKPNAGKSSLVRAVSSAKPKVKITHSQPFILVWVLLIILRIQVLSFPIYPDLLQVLLKELV